MFETSVYPILLMRCEDCHAPGREAGRSKLLLTGNARFDRAMVVALVTPGNPADSQLLIQAAGGDLHPGGVHLSTDSAEYQTISDWISLLSLAP
jgi:hypothetical protein